MLGIKDKKKRAYPAGFTLLEILIAMAISVAVFAAVMSAYIFVGRNLTRLANTQQLEVSSNRSFYLFSKDVSAATAVATGSNSTSLILTLPNKTVTYTYTGAQFDQGFLTRIASPPDVTTPEDVGDPTLDSAKILRHLSSFSFSYFDKAGNATSSAISVKQLEFNFVSTLRILTDESAATVEVTSKAGTQGHYSGVSPRLLLRNKALPP
jgi:prepilin-type N-terminal cleavage/methylation domain-containing protein